MGAGVDDEEVTASAAAAFQAACWLLRPKHSLRSHRFITRSACVYRFRPRDDRAASAPGSAMFS